MYWMGWWCFFLRLLMSLALPVPLVKGRDLCWWFQPTYGWVEEEKRCGGHGGGGHQATRIWNSWYQVVSQISSTLLNSIKSRGLWFNYQWQNDYWEEKAMIRKDSTKKKKRGRRICQYGARTPRVEGNLISTVRDNLERHRVENGNLQII